MATTDYQVPYSIKHRRSKIWQTWWITAIHQVFSPIFIIFIIFPMQMDFNSPTFFPPNFLWSLFAKLFTAKVFYCTVLQEHWYFCFAVVLDLKGPSALIKSWQQYTISVTVIRPNISVNVESTDHIACCKRILLQMQLHVQDKTIFKGIT